MSTLAHRRFHLVIAWGGALGLLLLHLDFWRPQRVVVYMGWIPEELLYRLAWMLLAWGYLLYICKVHWRVDES